MIATDERRQAAWDRVNGVLSPPNKLPAFQASQQSSASTAVAPPPDWQTCIKSMFAGYIPYDLSQPHIDFWEWVDDIDDESTPQPFVGIWPRGRGKSTHLECAFVYLGAFGHRRYGWYVSETQEQADKHIVALRDMMESDEVSQYFPDIGKPEITKTGGQNWRRNLLVTKGGFSVEAIGLDKAIRGGKLKTQRPDIIGIDDVDGKHDTEKAVMKKQDTLTTSILPAGSYNCAVVFMQNLIHPDSIAHRLSKQTGEKGAADYLANRVISGPHQAVDGLKYDFTQKDSVLQWVVTAGESLWEGFTIDIVEAEINRAGPTAFELESQHEIDTDSDLALLSTAVLNATRVSSVPDLIRAAVAVDPSGGAGQCGIIGGGTAKINGVTHSYDVLDNSTPKGTPSNEWAAQVLITYMAIKADCIYVERNFGGDMAKTTIQATKLVKTLNGRFRAAAADDIVFEDAVHAREYTGSREPVVLVLDGANVKIIEVTASRGKEVRAEPVASLYQQGRIHHYGFLSDLQKQWTQWEPGTKPSPDRLDADVWLQFGLGMIEASSNWDDVKGLGQVEIVKSKWG